MAAGALQAFLASREALIAGVSGGTEDARALSDLTDRALLDLIEQGPSAPYPPFALFALGGYGARRLLPHSDIDLLVVSDAGKAALDPLVRALFYPLWDAGLTVGHQVRTPKDHANAVLVDVEILTSFLTARLIAGDEGLAHRTLTATFRRIRRDASRQRAAIGARERPGSPYLLEADLKEGPGGQRDIDELVWRAALASGAPAHDVSPLVENGTLTAIQAEALAVAQDSLSAARWRLHRAAGRPSNVLDGEGDVGVDADRTQKALELVHHTLLAVRDGTSGGAPAPLQPLAASELLGAAARGPAALDDLERAAWTGRLDHAVPGFAELMTLRRPALSHRFTVGAHSLRTVVMALRPREGSTPAALGGVYEQALVVAALSHDLGKQQEGPGHAKRGAPEARAVAERFGLHAPVGALAETLVREHLLMADVATTRDLNDEDVVLEAAARVGDAELVRPLFLLTAADMQATGPDVWTPWRASLIAELASKLEVALSPEMDGAGIVAAAEHTRRESLRRASAVGASRAVLRFLEHAPLRYLAHRTPEEVLNDARLVQSLAGPGRPGEVAFSVTAGGAPGTWLVEIVTRDRPGLFATIAGVLALSGLDVLHAEAFTDRTGIALDTFTVTSATLAPIEPSSWSGLERKLTAAVAGRLDLEVRLAERQRHYSGRSPASVPVAVRVGTRSVFTTAVIVRAPDRVGLLHDLALAFSTQELDIRHAVITATGGAAEDTFHVVDAYGTPPDPAVLTRKLLPLLHSAAGG